MQQRFLLEILLLAQHVSGHHYAHHQELKSIIQWLLPVVFQVVSLVWSWGLCVRFAGCCVVFRAVVFKLLVWCGAEGYVSGLQDAATCHLVIISHLCFDIRVFSFIRISDKNFVYISDLWAGQSRIRGPVRW